MPVNLWKRRLRTDFIVIHCSATPATMDVDAAEIDRWHKARGWQGIGYARVIKRDGTIEDGRPIWAIGAHVEGYNSNSVGVCMVGGTDKTGKKEENNFTPAQWKSLKEEVIRLKQLYPNAVIQGHRDFPNVNKYCPSFDARDWWKTVLQSIVVDSLRPIGG